VGVILRASTIFNDSRFSLIAVESVTFQHSEALVCRQWYGSIKPIALVVCDQGHVYALDTESKPVSVCQLKQDLPELNAMINACAFTVSDSA